MFGKKSVVVVERGAKLTDGDLLECFAGGMSGVATRGCLEVLARLEDRMLEAAAAGTTKPEEAITEIRTVREVRAQVVSLTQEWLARAQGGRA